MSGASPQVLLVTVFVAVVVAAFTLMDASERPSNDPLTHTVAHDTEYYTGGPQQGRPPEGTLSAGTRVEVLEEAGSYARVRTANGLTAYVAASALEAVDGTDVPDEELTDEVRAAARGGNQLALDLYGQLRTSDGNLFFSPASIATAFAMTYAGAEGETEAQMADVLHFDLAEPRLHEAYGTLGRILNSGGPRAPYQLSMANRLWAQRSYQFRPQFLATTRDSYGAEVASVDFAKRSEETRRSINTWVAEETAGKIPDLMPSGSVGPLTRLVLTNAIYFKGTWAEEFRPSRTRDAQFFLTAERGIDVPMMRQTEHFPYAEIDDLQLLQLPYKGNDLAMVIVLPKQVDGLAPLEQSLTLESLEQWLEALNSREVQVHVPRFKLTSEFELTDTLRALGLTLPFTEQADFTGMSAEEQLLISAVIHKAFVDVNEEGTEAAAATGIAMAATAMPVDEPTVFKADRPFLFLIRDLRTGSFLFMGRVTNPKG